MHDATSPLLVHRSTVLSRSDAILSLSATHWKLPDPLPPLNRQGGVEREPGPPTLFPYQKKTL